MRTTILSLLAAGAALSQTTAPPAFEVASVRAAGPITIDSVRSGKLRIGMKVDAAIVNIGSMTLADLIRTAYRVKSYQVSGPDWINQERYDVVAKIPEGTSADQVPEMLQSLLTERFKLTLRREQKEHSVYALVVGKNGPKLKEATPDPPGPPAEGSGVDKGQIRVSGAGEGKAMVFSSNSGSGTVKMSPDSGIHMERKMTMDAFAELLGRFTDRPVVDMTELKGTYELSIDLSMGELLRSRYSNVMINGAANGAQVDPAAAREAIDRMADSSGGPSVFASVQKLGLKLEPRKGPVELLVVDHAEKTPTEN